MTADMFPVNQHLTVVLFDSGSSHSFMSQAFAQKHDQKIEELGFSCRISSAGADVCTRMVVRDVAIDFGSQRCGMDLIVLPGLPLDVILGMSWMKRWKAVLDTASRTLSFIDP
jgi:predicted aspartyl protease